MMSIRNHGVAVWGVAATLASGLVASAGPAFPGNAGPVDRRPPVLLAVAGGPDTCGDNDHVEQQGGSSGTIAKVCQGGGPVWIGAAVGQAVWMGGPVVTGPAQVNSVVSAGNILVGGV